MRKKAKKRTRLPSLKRLQARADRLWSKMILAQGTGACQVCHTKEAVSAHHIFHKGAHGRARYDLRNGLSICTGCHLRERFDPTPVVFAAIAYKGVEIFALERDVRQFRGPHPWTRDRLNCVILAMETIMEVPDAADPVAR